MPINHHDIKSSQLGSTIKNSSSTRIENFLAFTPKPNFADTILVMMQLCKTEERPVRCSSSGERFGTQTEKLF